MEAHTCTGRLASMVASQRMIVVLGFSLQHFLRG